MISSQDSISVIVPVYNVAPYLRQCLDSLKAQTFQNFEAILVDDGSTDKSGEICEDYAKHDERFKVLHKDNRGLVSARKAGYEMASGRYIANIDSDDWIENNHLQILYEDAINNNADIVQTDYYINTGQKQTVCVNKPRSCEIPQVISDCLDGTIHSGLWVKLIDRDLYKKECFRFPPCNFNEDLHTTISLLVNARKYSYVPIPTYHYRMNDSSMTHDFALESKIRKFRERMTNLTDLYERLKLKDNPQYKEKLLSRVNTMKRGWIKGCPNNKELNSMLDYFPNSYHIGQVKSTGDFFFYLACQHRFFLPYKIKKLIR